MSREDFEKILKEAKDKSDRCMDEVKEKNKEFTNTVKELLILL